jgi:subtilisin family serine protease
VDPALWELLRAEAGADGDRALEAVIRLARPGLEIPDVRIVSRFGTIVTCRIQARDVVPVRARPDVISFKAARGLSPEFEPSLRPPDSAGPALPGICPTDVRRDPALTLTGAGVVVAAVDWGVDVDSAALRWPADPVAAGGHKPGGTRLLSFWDQRDQAVGPRLDPYGYGSVHGRDEIDRALQDPRPYDRLGYHPAVADLKANGTHGTRICDIAAGNGRAGGPVGIAPEADLIFVHLADRNTGGLAPFGDSVRLLEAVDYISRTAGSQPCVINISAGRTCGPKDGTTLVERAFDELLASTPGRFIVNSAGNYRCWRTHSCGTIAPGETRSLSVVVDPADVTLNEVEIWYDGADEFAVRIDPPGYTAGRPVCLGERSDLLIGGRVIGRVYHRKHDPNNGHNHIVAYLDPIGLAGNWTVTLEARRVHSGLFHAWIERDDSCPGCQARFTADDSNRATTVGSIATSHLPLIVGAYNGHDPARPAASFSSCGPTEDDRLKPDLVAPGVDVLAARSAPAGASRNPGSLVRGSGTSYATPHVTGAVALCFQVAGNRLSARQIRYIVLGSCDPVPNSDQQCRFGRGYLNLPRLVADVQQTLAAPATTLSSREQAMDTDDTVLLAADPAIAYREFLYRPSSQLARWIGDRFDVVAKPGQRIGQVPREGDVLIEINLGRLRAGRCITLSARELQLMASRPGLAPGQLLLRPRRPAGTREPLPAEPTGAGEYGRSVGAAEAAPASGPETTVAEASEDTDTVSPELWDAANPDPGLTDIVYTISVIEKPGAVQDFWESQVRPHRADWAVPLSDLEWDYIEAFTDPRTPEPLQMRKPVDPAHLTPEEHSEADSWFGTGPDSVAQYANYENRRRIVANYVYTHPATVRLELGLYRLIRDINPVHFALERGWQMGRGREMFTGEDVSRLGAAGEFLLSLALIYGVGRALKEIRPSPQFGVPRGRPRALTDPIYELPPEGGGLSINGRWYTEHALERMAPDTPQVREQLQARVKARLDRLGIRPGNPAYDKVLARALKKINPRGVDPATVEAELQRPGSTRFRVISAKRGQVIITVIPRR